MTKKLLSAILAILISTVLPLADEGMWTFDNPPRQQWKERYDFQPTCQIDIKRGKANSTYRHR